MKIKVKTQVALSKALLLLQTAALQANRIEPLMRPVKCQRSKRWSNEERTRHQTWTLEWACLAATKILISLMRLAMSKWRLRKDQQIKNLQHKNLMEVEIRQKCNKRTRRENLKSEMIRLSEKLWDYKVKQPIWLNMRWSRIFDSQKEGLSAIRELSQELRDHIGISGTNLVKLAAFITLCSELRLERERLSMHAKT